MNSDELYFYYRDLMAKRHGIKEAQKLEDAMMILLNSNDPGKAWDYARKQIANLDRIAIDTQMALNYGYYKLTGSITAARNLIVPTNKKFYVVEHAVSGGFNIVVKTSAGSGVTLVNGDKKLLYCDGSNVVGPIS